MDIRDYVVRKLLRRGSIHSFPSKRMATQNMKKVLRLVRDGKIDEVKLDNFDLQCLWELDQRKFVGGFANMGKNANGDTYYDSVNPHVTISGFEYLEPEDTNLHAKIAVWISLLALVVSGLTNLELLISGMEALRKLISGT